MEMNETTPKDQAWDDEVGRKVWKTYVAFEEEIMRVRDRLKAISDTGGDDGSAALRATQECLEAATALRQQLETRAVKESPPR